MEGLTESSVFYRSRAEVYAAFAKAQDAQGKIAELLGPKFAGQEILDLGSGTGKYARLFGPIAKTYQGVDQASEVLAIAKYGGASLAGFARAAAEALPFKAGSFDIVFGSWVLGTILDIPRRIRAVEECARVLKESGQIFLVENDLGGEFEAIRGRYPDIRRTKEYNVWLEQAGFEVFARLTTRFLFPSSAFAGAVIAAIWGPAAARKLRGNMIEQRVIVYHCLPSGRK